MQAAPARRTEEECRLRLSRREIEFITLGGRLNAKSAAHREVDDAGSRSFDQLRSARAARSVPVLVLPLDIELLFDVPEFVLLRMPLLPMLELFMPLEVVDPVVEGEPLDGCERSPCDKPGVVVLLGEPLVPIEELPVPIVVPVVPDP